MSIESPRIPTDEERYDAEWDRLDNQGLDGAQIRAKLGPPPYETVSAGTLSAPMPDSVHEQLDRHAMAVELRKAGGDIVAARAQYEAAIEKKNAELKNIGRTAVQHLPWQDPAA